jgi:hypothetical protein
MKYVPKPISSECHMKPINAVCVGKRQNLRTLEHVVDTVSIVL